jgi:diguanylate cyclase (GGDEF)-like protein
MRWPVAGLAAGALALLLACLPVLVAAAAAAAPPMSMLQLRDSDKELDAAEVARTWVDPHRNATIEQVAVLAATGAFARPEGGLVQQSRDEGALWLHLRLRRPAEGRQEWLLTVPMTVVDLVTVYQRDGAGWRPATAGDTLAVNRWPERGRYPVFRLDLPADEARDVFVRIRHATPAIFPIRLTPAPQHREQVQLDYLGLGAAFGAMLLLIVGCIARGWVYRDQEFAWYALYAGLTTIAVSSYTGVAPHLLWPGFGLLEDSMTSILGAAAAGAALLFVRNTLGLRRRLPLQARLSLVTGVAAVLVALVPAVAPKAIYVPLVGGYITLATLLTVAVAAAAWWRGDPVGKWVFAAQFPMVTSVLANMFRTLGWATVPFVSQSSIVVAMAIEVPLLLVALFMRSRDRHSAEVREQALSTHDALTGLLSQHLFHDRLQQVVTRYRRHGESSAIMYIDLVNHGRIREAFGPSAGEQSLLRSVIKLRRLLRDVDTVARVGEARFGVILEGASARSSVTERAARLIAAGLMPLPGLVPDVTLQFHVAAVLLNERALEAEEVELALDEQLGRMSPRTRRPIRFITPVQSASSDTPPDAVRDSSMFAPDVLLDDPAPDADADLATAR